MKKGLKLISVCLLVCLLFSNICLAANNVALKSQQHSVLVQDKKYDFDEKTIKSIDKYIDIDNTTKLFFINKQGKKNLKGEKLKLAQLLIDRANNYINLSKSDNSLSISISDHKSIVIKSTSVEIDNGINDEKIMARSINHIRYSDWEINWWGIRVYLSHECVNDLQENQTIATAASGGVGVVSSGIGIYVLETAGLGSAAGPLGTAIGAAIGVAIAVNLYLIVTRDLGRGVYLDYNFLGMCNPIAGVVLNSISPVPYTC